MTLIVEDGSQVSGANSFVDDAEYVAYAAARGLVIGADATLREIELILSMDYLASIEYTLQGYRVSSDQSLLYPRNNVYLHGWLLASDAIPSELKSAQMEAAAFETTGSTLTNSTNSNVESKKLDTMEVSYFKGGSKQNTVLNRVNAYLQPLQNVINKLVRT